MTDYKLDVSSWRSGGESQNKVGKGITFMLNPEGYMCCLGQFAKHIGVAPHRFYGYMNPIILAETLGECYDPAFVYKTEYGTLMDNTNLAVKLMRYNDDEKTDPKEKIALIRQELEKYGHTLTVVNEQLLEEK